MSARASANESEMLSDNGNAQQNISSGEFHGHTHTRVPTRIPAYRTHAVRLLSSTKTCTQCPRLCFVPTNLINENEKQNANKRRSDDISLDKTINSQLQNPILPLGQSAAV